MVFTLITTMALSAGAGMGIGSGWPGPLGLALEAFRLWSFFAAGALVYALRHKVSTSPVIGVASGALVAITYVTGINDWASQIPLTVFFLWLGAILPIRLGARNDISYGMYIYAFPVQQLLVAILGDDTNPWLFMIAAVACTVPFALLSWHFVEKPAMRIRLKPRRKSDEYRTSDAAA